MISTRLFAIVYGAVFLLIGIAGFIPNLLAPHTHPDLVVTAGMGLLFGLFAVNVLHNLVHIIFGIWGLVAARTEASGRAYAKVVAIGYAILMVMGFIPVLDLYTTFGLVPLYGHDIWLHAGLAAVAAYFGWRRPRDHASRHTA